MLLGSMTTGDIMAARAFVFGMSWTQWATAAEYQQYINAGGPPVADTRVTRGGSGRNTGRGRSPSVRRGYTSRPTTPTRTLAGPRATASMSSSSTSAAAPSFGRDDTAQPAAASEQIHQEHPGLNKAEVRAQVRARILALVDRFTVDILSSTEAERARVMAAFRQWDEDTIKSALDPDWDRHAFFQRIEADNNLTEWASKISNTMQQHYICRKIGCQAVVDNKHWLRKISPHASIKEQRGRYNCPHCLNAYRPWIQQTNLVPAQKALIVAAPDTMDLSRTTGAQQLPVRQPVVSARTNYFLYLTEWEKKGEDRLLQQLKLAILNIQQEITDRDDFNHFITEALKDVANKNQPLPYFVRETWPKNSILGINSRNVSGANPPYRLDLLPAAKYPDKFFRKNSTARTPHEIMVLLSTSTTLLTMT